MLSYHFSFIFKFNTDNIAVLSIMKTLIQKIYVEENHSFACRTYSTPNFETTWHIHEEVEIIVITKGAGTAMIGDYVGDYKEGDVYYISSNLPHCFRKHKENLIGSAIVAQFNKSIFGATFLKTPELRAIDILLQKTEAFSLKNRTKEIIGNYLEKLEYAKGADRMNILLCMLSFIGTTKENELVTSNFKMDLRKTNPMIESILDYTFKHYLEPITLNELSSYTKMSIPTFCRFFKKNIKKTYFDFLQELRINQACKLLRTTDKPIINICYESGYNSWAHFSKKFKEIQKITPGKYRKEVVEI